VHLLRRRGLITQVTPLQLGQKLRRIHSARLDEALVTAAILLGCALLEERVKRPKQYAVIGEILFLGLPHLPAQRGKPRQSSLLGGRRRFAFRGSELVRRELDRL
jgi:hypothetical protein